MLVQPEKRKVASLLLEASFAVEHGEALGRLKADVGDVVEVDRLLELVGKRLPEIAAHPDFEHEGPACIDAVLPMLGLEPWEMAWFVTRSGITQLRDFRRVVNGTSSEALRQALRTIGPSLRRPAELAAALVRTMPDLQSDATLRELVARMNGSRVAGIDRTAASSANGPSTRTLGKPRAARPTKQTARSTAAREMSWRPNWWLDLREWSAERGFRLKRLDVPQGSSVREYFESVVSLLASDEDLALPHWRTGFSKPAGMTDVDRIEVHAHLVHQALKRVRVLKKHGPYVTPPSYTELIKQAFFLGLDDDVVDVALARRFQQTATVTLRRGMRIKASVGPGRPLDEVLAIHDEVALHAKALGMSSDSNVSRATDVVAVTRWSLKSTAVAKAVRYRVPIVLIDDFLAAGMRAELESREIAFAAQRAAICGRCGIVHAFSARRVHRKDLLCPACR
jgi:hypothetical protein